MAAAAERHAETRVEELVEHLFRHQAGQMLATLTRIFGMENLSLAEDVVQEALLQALRVWPYRGIPDNPRAWLVRVARNRALDALRRKASLRRAEDDLRRWTGDQDEWTPWHALPSGVLADDTLAMMFACCHPALPHDSIHALTLKAVSGFSVQEIGRAFLTDPTTIAQRLVRAKRRIREARIELCMPSPGELPERLDSVLRVLYLLFNEGYTAHSGDDLVRADLCEEAMRLAALLERHPATTAPRVHALLALFYLQAARLPARLDANRDLLLLEEQDRGRWDHALLRAGLAELDASASGDEVSEYHLQAGIAALHATTADFASTDWHNLLGLYDQLLELAPSPVAALNRAIVLSMIDGPDAGLRAIGLIEREPSLRSYYLLPAARADLLRQMGRNADAAAAYCRALELPCTEPERRFLRRRLQEVDPLR